ncbi:hypothetical protein FNV43_RR06351 [Rhamnella rubrinervis]|uniref:Uncharacterized protein n=1 Tax=Rhamnella rubrinervis TaxID=2594499 RepID=A0A8K0HCW1_9ROSA|nr:hypothetical protein FNV43_RR06351 [Rhamnella rubrinervis]
MPIFLHFFYLKPGGEGRYAFYARRQTKLLTGAPTSDKGWKDRYFFIRKEGLFDPGSSELDIRRPRRALNQSARLSTNSEQNNSIDTLHAAGKNLNLLLSAKSFRNRLKVPPPTKEQLAEKDRKRKEKKSARKSRKSDPTQRADPTLDNTVAISPDVIAPSTEETPPQKKQRLSSPQPTAKGKEPMLAQTSRFLYEAIVKVDAACKKKTAAYESSAETNKTLQATNKTLEANNLHLKQAAADANSRAEQAELKLLQAEKKWSETDQKLAEKNKELEALRLDFSHVAAERDELQARVGAWPRKKKIVYRKGVEDAYLRAQKEMILKFKAGQTSWATPEPSEDDSDDGEGSEISSGEDEPEPNNESPEDCTPAPEKSSPHEKDSFDEAMEEARTNTAGPSTNAKEVASASQPSQEEAITHPSLFEFCCIYIPVCCCSFPYFIFFCIGTDGSIVHI